jgi:hypothetical protein
MRPAPPQKELFVRPVPSSDTVFVNERVCFQTEEKQRVIFVHGVIFSHYALEDRTAEAWPGFAFSNRDTQIRTISHVASAIRLARFAAIRSASRLVD